MWGCVRYLTQVSVLPAADDSQLFSCGEAASSTGRKKKKKNTGLLSTATSSESYFNHLRNIYSFKCSPTAFFFGSTFPQPSSISRWDALLPVGATCCFSTQLESWRSSSAGYALTHEGQGPRTTSCQGNLSYHMKQKMTRGETKQVKCRVVWYSHT